MVSWYMSSFRMSIVHLIPDVLYVDCQFFPVLSFLYVCIAPVKFPGPSYWHQGAKQLGWNLERGFIGRSRYLLWDSPREEVDDDDLGLSFSGLREQVDYNGVCLDTVKNLVL